MEKRGHTITFNSRDQEFDIVHSHNAFDPFVLKKIRGIPIVVHGHSVRADLEGGIMGYRIFSPLLTWLMRKTYSQADHIIPVSEFAADDIKRMGIQVPMTVISNGVPLGDYPFITDEERRKKREEIVEKYNLNSSQEIILSVGSLMRRKGILDVIKLAKLLPEYQFLWVGGSQPIYPYWYLREQMGRVPQNFRLLGYIDNLLDLYQGLDYYLNPSFVETEGIPILEAAASGIPIIMRDIPAFEGWKDGTHCQKFKKIEEVQNLIRGDKNIQSMVEASHKRVQKYDIHHICDRIEKIYNSLCQTPLEDSIE